MSGQVKRKPREASEEEFNRWLSSFIWLLFVFFCISGIIMQLNGLVSVHFDAGPSFLWWSGFPLFSRGLIMYIYLLGGPPFIFLVSWYVHSLREMENESSLVSRASMISLLPGMLWAVSFYYQFFFKPDYYNFALRLIVWSGAIVFFGMTFFLVGLMMLKKQVGRRWLTIVTSASFMLVGFIGVVVGSIGGFTLLPFFSIYDFPWVTGTAIVPSILTIFYIYDYKERGLTPTPSEH